MKKVQQRVILAFALAAIVAAGSTSAQEVPLHKQNTRPGSVAKPDASSTVRKASNFRYEFNQRTLSRHIGSSMTLGHGRFLRAHHEKFY